MYCMTNESVTKATNVSLEPTNRSVLGFVRVVGGVSVPYAKLTQHIRDSVIRDARRNMPTDVRDQVIADLSNGFGLQKFVSHKTIATNEVTGKQELVFNIDLSNPRPRGRDGNRGSDEESSPDHPSQGDHHDMSLL